MTSTAIKEELKAKGIRYSDLVDELGVSPTYISFVVNGKAVSDRVQRAIADKLGKDPVSVFPERYQFTKTDEEEKQEEVSKVSTR